MNFFQNIKKLIFSSPTAQEDHTQISLDLLSLSAKPTPGILQTLSSTSEGLDEEEAAERLKKYGPNEIAHEKPPTWYSLLLRNFANPFVVLLIVLGLISYFLQQYDSVIIITFMVLLGVLMRFFQEYRSNKIAEKLKALVSTKATVIRRKSGESVGKKEEIDIKNLVPGDIVHLSAGDMVPADVKLINAKGLYISQAALSGEAMPVEKDESLAANANDSNPLSIPNLCFLGTNVLNGTALALVLRTGGATYFGSMAKSLTGYRPLTSFDLGVNKVSWLLIRFILIMVPIVFVINGITKGDWFQAFLFSLSVAVGLTPEMLPMIVTANLARGAMRMSKSQVVVKRLNSIQNFGAMDILCTDKTGTLTQDHIILEKNLDAEGKENEEVLFYGFLNSYYQTGLKNLLDLAVLEHKEMEEKLKGQNTWKKIDEIPFDFTRRRMSVIVEKSPQEHLLITKGAVEEILDLCVDVRINGSTQPLTDELKQKLQDIKKNLNEDGLRILSVGLRTFPANSKKEYYPPDESQLTFMGFLAFLDPPKASADKALKNLHTYNVQVKVLTGDNELVTQTICKWVNLKVQGVLVGDQIEKMNDDELKEAVEKNTIFAKLNPLQKAKVIRALKRNGHTVGFLGDGINDAPALREADIGISVDTAVDIAKESADIIMLEKSLLFLGQGVLEGRRTFANIIKYIKMALSSNFGNVFSIMGASVLFPFLPMQSVQILFQNLLYDISQIPIPFDNVDREFLKKPRQWDPSGIGKFMLYIGPISSIFDYATFAVMWFVFSANTVEKQAIFQTGWFIEGLLSQTLIVHLIRTQKIPFIQSTASWPMIITTLLVMGAGIYIPFSFIGESIGLVPLPLSYFVWLFAILTGYCILLQLAKQWFINKFHYWL